MSNSSPLVVLVDDEQQILFSYSLILHTAGINNVLTLDDSRRVLPLLVKEDAAMIVLDLIMPHMSGTELLSTIKQEFPHIPVIIMTAVNEMEMAVECMKAGAADYLIKPVEKSKFISTIQKVLEIRDLRLEVSSLKQHLLTDTLENETAFSRIVTQNKKMRATFRYMEAIAKSPKPVLITGETGTGKELIAQVIHDLSGVEGQFVTVNVAGLDETMFSDTLFGHRKGAYTGAEREREGLIPRASDGTLLLDEIGDLNELSQIKLLRLLDENTYYPLGSDSPQINRARVIGATNHDIKKMASDEKFRKDLYYRLSTHSIHIPPLRERPEDIPLLLDHFLELAARSLDRKKPAPPPELPILLSNYHFPGNVREFQSMIFDAVAQHKSGILSLNSFRKIIEQKSSRIPEDITSSEKNPVIFPDMPERFPTLKESEDFLISEALKRAKGKQGLAALLLGISRQALNKRLLRKKK